MCVFHSFTLTDDFLEFSFILSLPPLLVTILLVCVVFLLLLLMCRLFQLINHSERCVAEWWCSQAGRCITCWLEGSALWSPLGTLLHCTPSPWQLQNFLDNRKTQVMLAFIPIFLFYRCLPSIREKKLLFIFPLPFCPLSIILLLPSPPPSSNRWSIEQWSFLNGHC